MTATALRPAPRAGRATGAGAAVVALAVVVPAALSLLLPWALAFDPLAWLVWGRDISRLALDTTTGPSWKPFPVLFTVVIAPLGGVAPALWLVIARAGALLALVGAYVLGDRVAGRWAGVAAAGAIALSPWWLFNAALGNSEGMLAAAVLWAVIAHLAGRHRAALALATAAALMRPEVWPFLAAYSMWLWRADRRAVVIAAVIVPALWFGPDLIGAGGAVGAFHTARGIPSPGSAKLEPIPALAVLVDTATILSWPALIAAALGAALTEGLARRLALAAAAWVVIVAAMTAAGYAGNPRYLVAAAALGAVVAGAGAVRAAGPVGAGILLVGVLAFTGPTLNDQLTDLASRARAADEFDGVIGAAGGRDALVDCSRIRTSFRARSFVAWRLDLPMRDIDLLPERPAVVIRAQWFYGEGLEPRAPGYRVLASRPYWQVAAACGKAPQVG